MSQKKKYYALRVSDQYICFSDSRRNIGRQEILGAAKLLIRKNIGGVLFC